MTKKNLKPQQAAPVQREINTTSSDGGGITWLTPQYMRAGPGINSWAFYGTVFAGDDEE